VWLKCLYVLAELAREDEGKKKMLQNRGVITYLIYVIQDLSAEKELRDTSAKALANLMENADRPVMKAVIKAGAIKPLVEQFKSTQPTVIAASVKALYTLAQHHDYEQCAAQMIEEGVVRLLADILKENNDTKVVEHACSLIAQLCANQQVVDAQFLSSTVPTSLIMLMHHDTVGVRKSAKRALKVISEKTKKIPKMIQLLNSRHKHVRKTAKAVLRSTPILYVATYPKMLENTEDEESGSETEDEEDNLRQKRGSKISVRKTFQRLHVHVPHIQKDKEKKLMGKNLL